MTRHEPLAVRAAIAAVLNRPQGPDDGERE